MQIGIIQSSLQLIVENQAVQNVSYWKVQVLSNCLYLGVVREKSAVVLLFFWCCRGFTAGCVKYRKHYAFSLHFLRLLHCLYCSLFLLPLRIPLADAAWTAICFSTYSHRRTTVKYDEICKHSEDHLQNLASV